MTNSTTKSFSTKRYIWPTTIGLLVLNLFLKLFWYADISLWLDEAFSIFQAQKDIGEIIEACKVDQNPPLYLILLHYWMDIFGMSEFSVRGFSIFFSSLTPVALFIGLRKYLGFGVTLFAALLFSFSDVHFFYANEARTFALVGFLCAVSFGLFFRCFYKGSYLFYTLLGLVNLTAIYCHYIAVFIPVTQFFVGLFYIRDGKGFVKGLLISNTIALIALLPWVRYVIEAMPEKGIYWLQPPGIKQLAGLFIRFSGGKIFLGLFALVALVWLFYNRSRITKLFNWKRNEKFALISLVSWVAIPVLLDYLVSLKAPVFLDRYLLYVSLGFYLLLGYFLFNLPGKVNLRLMVAFTLVLMFVVTLKIDITKDEDWRSAVAKLKEERQGKQTVVCSAWYTNMIFAYYYDKEIFKHYHQLPDLLKEENIYFTNTLDISTLDQFNPTKELYVVLGHSEDADPEETVLGTIELQYQKVQEKNFEKIKVISYKAMD